MQATVSDFIVQRMLDWGVRRVFGYPGDGINGVVGAIARHQDRMQFVQTRHEEMAAFAACGHAKFTGETGVCLATSGPGAIHLLTGLYDARADHQPVVAIVGQQSRMSLGGQYQQEVDLVALFHDVASEFVQMITVPTQARHVIDQAFRIATSKRVPTCVIVPADVQKLPAERPPQEHGSVHSGMGYARPRVVPDEAELVRAADVLNAGKRVAILVGAGAAGAADEVLAVADVLGAGIAKALLGKPVLPDDLPHVTGGIGLLGTAATQAMMTECDTLLVVGSSFPYSEFLPDEGQARGVQIDIDPAMLALRYPMEVSLTGDCALTLNALLPLLERRKSDEWRRKIDADVQKWWGTLEKRAMQESADLNPQRVFWELSPLLPERALLACDTGTTVHWYSRDLKLRSGMKAAHSGGLASMGAAMPYAIAAKFAYPDRIAFAFVGDGAMQMNGMNEMITVSRYWKTWANPRFIVLVMNNRDLNMVSWEQRIIEGEPKFPGSQDVPDIPYATLAGSLGFEAFRMEKTSEVRDTWMAALECDRPVLIEALVDPNVPPLPPHVSQAQIRNYLKALVSGDPDSRQIVRETIRQIFA